MSDIVGNKPELAEYLDPVSDDQSKLSLYLIGYMEYHTGYERRIRATDMGCNTWRLARQAFRMIGLIAPSGNLVGVEPSPHRVRVANDRLWTSGTSNISFTIGQGEALRGLEDETFDRLYYFIFHRIGGKRAALQEAYRVLKPGGRVNIILWVRLVPLAGRSAFSQILDRHLKIALPYRNRRSDRRSDQKELQGLLTEIGFANARTNNDDSSLLFESSEACYAFMRESSYELLPRLPAQLRAEIMAMSSEELEKRRTQVGIKIEIESLVVIAKKPKRVFP